MQTILYNNHKDGAIPLKKIVQVIFRDKRTLILSHFSFYFIQV